MKKLSQNDHETCNFSHEPPSNIVSLSVFGINMSRLGIGPLALAKDNNLTVDRIINLTQTMDIANTQSVSVSAATAAMAARFVLYTLCILTLALMLPLAAQYQDAAAFKENGPIEWVQFGLLLGVSVLFARESIRSTRISQVFVLLACLAAFAGVREMDAILNAAIPVVGWKVGGLLLMYAVYAWYRHKELIGQQIVECLNTPAFYLLWTGFIIAIPFAQLVGNGAFLEAIMQADYDRDYKRIIEELGELMGYSLLLIGSVELIVQQRSGAPMVHNSAG